MTITIHHAMVHDSLVNLSKCRRDAFAALVRQELKVGLAWVIKVTCAACGSSCTGHEAGCAGNGRTSGRHPADRRRCAMPLRRSAGTAPPSEPPTGTG